MRNMIGRKAYVETSELSTRILHNDFAPECWRYFNLDRLDYCISDLRSTPKVTSYDKYHIIVSIYADVNCIVPSPPEGKPLAPEVCEKMRIRSQFYCGSYGATVLPS
jgi:hypothetical protein